MDQVETRQGCLGGNTSGARPSHLRYATATTNRLSLTVSLSEKTYPAADQRRRFFQQALRRTEGLAGVRSAALASNLPVDQEATPVLPVKADGVAEAAGSGAYLTKAALRVVSPGYLRMLSIPLERGRMFGEQDDARVENVALMNASLARRLWEEQDPVGRRIEYNGQRLMVVGVVRDVAIRNLPEGPEYEVLLPFAQALMASMTLIAHTAADPAPLVAEVRGVLHSLDADQPVTNAYALEGLRTELFRPVSVALNVPHGFGGGEAAGTRTDTRRRSAPRVPWRLPRRWRHHPPNQGAGQACLVAGSARTAGARRGRRPAGSRVPGWMLPASVASFPRRSDRRPSQRVTRSRAVRRRWCSVAVSRHVDRG